MLRHSSTIDLPIYKKRKRILLGENITVNQLTKKDGAKRL